MEDPCNHGWMTQKKQHIMDALFAIHHKENTQASYFHPLWLLWIPSWKYRDQSQLNHSCQWWAKRIYSKRNHIFWTKPFHLMHHLKWKSSLVSWWNDHRPNHGTPRPTPFHTWPHNLQRQAGMHSYLHSPIIIIQNWPRTCHTLWWPITGKFFAVFLS